MAWYDEVNFYELRLINGNWETWMTTLSYQEAKEAIGNQSFITVTYRAEKTPDKELNTKVIESIRDVTDMERKSYRETAENKEKRLQLVQKIRSIPLSRYYRWRFGLSKEFSKGTMFDWYDKAVGVDLDPLMKWNESYLEELLVKCKEKRLNK